jgi:iron complex outermembrane receptor protein
MRHAAQPQPRRPLSRLALAVGLAIGTLGLATPTLHAQTTPAKPEAKKDAEDKLETITVTAQRREQELQSVPLPVSTFTARDLEQRGVTNMLRVGEYIPNMVAQNNTGLGTANVYFIRALGNTESIATFDPPVGTYVNDIYVSRQNANNFSFFDVERIEVLRGPQGTLFGRNTTGGAMNVILKKPASKFGAFVEFGAGSYGGRMSRGSVDAPVSNNFRTKVSYFYNTDDGYVNNTVTGQKLNAQDSKGARAAFQWRLGGAIWDLAADTIEDKGLSIFNTREANGDRVSRSGLRTDIPGYFTPTGAPRFTGEKNNYPLGNNVRSESISSNVNLLLGGVSVDFITGWRDMTQKFAIDFGNTPVSTGGFTILNDGRHKQFTQEVKATGEAGALSWVAGVFYMDEKNKTDLGDLFNLAFSGGANVPLVLGDRTLNNDTKSTAFYLQGDHKLTPKTTLTAGARYTDDTKTIEFTENRAGLAPAAQLTTANMRAAGIPTSVDTKLTTPRFALSHQFNPDLMMFASATRGFKSGGWNARGTTPGVLTAFGVEKVWSYEAGWRASFLDNKVRFNGTAFRMDVKDLQTSSAFIGPTGAVTFIIQNFAGLQNQGLELELSAQPMRGLTAYINAGFQDAEYTDIAPSIIAQQARCRAQIASNAATRPDCLQGIVTREGNIAGPVRTPKRSVNPGVSYTFPTGMSNIRAMFNLNLSYQSDAVAGTAENAIAKAHTLTNVQVGLLGGDSWRLTLDCTNCRDKSWITAHLAGLNYLNDPRRYTVKFNYTFK